VGCVGAGRRGLVVAERRCGFAAFFAGEDGRENASPDLQLIYDCYLLPWF
jgi:hypothetical protein